MNDRTGRRSRYLARAEVGTYGNEPTVNGSGGHDSVVEESSAPASEPDSPVEAMFRRARELEQEGDLAGAHDLYQRLLLENPESVRARNNLGCIYDVMGRHTLALDQFQAASILAPDNIDVLLNLGDSLLALNRYDQAEREFRKAQRLDPARAESYVHLGVLYFKRGLYAQADLELKRAIELDPQDGDAYFYRGESLNQLLRVD
ncbi:MAG: tetratricopeptide repeat protein, partial [Longimicrobiales bacterium]